MIALILAVTLSHTLTPGKLAVDAQQQPLTKTYICAHIWGTDARHVSESMKVKILRRYGFTWRTPKQLAAIKQSVEFDHLISRENGGADAIENIWPEPLWEAKHEKDPIENEAHKRICGKSNSGKTLTLQAVQESLRSDWRHTLE